MLDIFATPNQYQKIIRPPTLQLAQYTPQSINNNVWDATSRIIWDTCEICDPGIGRPALPNTKISLPPGFNYFRLRAHMGYDSTVAGSNFRAMQISLGASSVDAPTNAAKTFWYNTQYVLDQYMFDAQTRWVPYGPNAWLEVINYQVTGAARNTPGSAGTNGPVWVSIEFDNVQSSDRFSAPHVYNGSFAPPTLIVELNAQWNPGATWALVPFDKIARDDLGVMDLNRVNGTFKIPSGITKMRATVYSIWNTSASTGNNYVRVDINGSTRVTGMRNTRSDGGSNPVSDWLSVKAGDLIETYFNNGAGGFTTNPTSLIGTPCWAMFEFSPD